jgi:RpiR family carbohydrate utilization transcriptional regulator
MTMAKNKAKAQTTCLPLLRSSYKDLTRSEQKIADCILQNPNGILHMTISELASTTQSGEATAFRFCHKLGFSGFQELKMALAGDILSPMKSLSQEVNREDSPQTISQKVFKNIIDDLQATLKILDYQELNRAIDAIAQARKIDAYGYGGSGVIALDIQHRFVRFGLQVNAYNDPHLQIASAALLTAKDVVIAVSHTGASIDLLKVLEMAKRNQATIIALTSYMKSPITKLADIVLCGIAKETFYRPEAMSSRLIHLAILDSLYTGVMLRQFETFSSNMGKVREAIAQEKL